MKRTCFIGIDISKKTFDICLYLPGSTTQKKFFKKENSLSGFKSFVNELKTLKINLNEIFVCLEYCGVYGLELGFFLEGKIEYCFCNPLQYQTKLRTHHREK